MTTGRINQVTAVHAAPAPRLADGGGRNDPGAAPPQRGRDGPAPRHAAHRNRDATLQVLQKKKHNPRTRGAGRDHARPEAARVLSTAPRPSTRTQQLHRHACPHATGNGATCTPRPSRPEHAGGRGRGRPHPSPRPPPRSKPHTLRRRGNAGPWSSHVATQPPPGEKHPARLQHPNTAARRLMPVSEATAEAAVLLKVAAAQFADS